MTTAEALETKPVVLIVDDKQPVLKAIERTCRAEEWTTISAGSGDQALEIMRSRVVDVVVSDMRMPGMKGAELVSHIADLFPETVCVLLSGYSDLADTIDAVNSGNVRAFITKPWDNDRLKSTIRKCLEGKGLDAKRENPFPADLIIDELEETRVTAEQLHAELVLSRDLVLPNGCLLLPRHHILGTELVEQVRAFELAEKQKLEVYVYAPVTTQETDTGSGN